MPSENDQTQDAFEAVVQHAGQPAQTIAGGGSPITTTNERNDTTTGLVVIVLVLYLIFKFFKKG